MPFRRIIPRSRDWLCMAKKSSKQIDLEHDYEPALGQLTRYFALLQYALEHIAWSIWNLHNEFGKILTKDLPAKHLSEKLLASLKVMDVDQKLASELQTILRTVEKLAQERNNL